MASRLMRYPSLLVFGVAALVMFVDLGGAKLWDRDEPRNAGCAREMLARGDWVVPLFNDELRPQKPVLLYWVMMVAYSAFGVSEWSARLGSAAFAVGTCLLTYGIGRRLFDVRVGTLAGIILATSIMFTVAGRAATPDSLLIFFQTAAIAVYVWGSPGFASNRAGAVDPDRDYFPRSFAAAALFYGLLGAGVLAKGAIAVVMPALIVGLHLLYVRLPARDNAGLQSMYMCTVSTLRGMFQPRHLGRSVCVVRPLFGTLVVLAIAAPWFVAVGLRTDGDFLRLFFGQEHWGRATQAFENHRGGLWYYPLAVSLGFFPWSVFLIPTLWGVRRAGRIEPGQAAGLALLVAWVACQIGVFSLVATKLPSYVTPCYPALALLVSAGLVALGTKQPWAPGLWYRWSLVGLGLSGLAVLAAAAVLVWKILPGHYSLLLLGILWLEAAVLAYLMFRGDRPVWGVQFLAGISVLAALFTFGVLPRQISAQRQLEQVLADVAEQYGRPPLATFRCLESSWIYYAEHPIWELAEGPAGGGSLHRPQAWSPKPRLTPAAFVAACPNAVLITTDAHWPELEAQLPKRYRIVRYAKQFPRGTTVLIAAPEELAGPQQAPRVARWRNAGIETY